MRVLILEDDVDRMKYFRRKFIGHEVTICDDTKELIKELIENKWDLLYLDHDLDGKVYVPSGEGTGYEVAEWLSNNLDKCPPEVYVHTLNGGGRKKMLDVLPQAHSYPFAWANIYILGQG